LQVVEVVVVAGLDVVGVCADPVALLGVLHCFASSVRSGFDLAPDVGPVAG
jgi:hypothetical protein